MRIRIQFCPAVSFFTLFLLLTFSTTGFAQRNLKDIPDPDPEIERKSFIVADGFEVNLFASDPRIAKPIQMNFDAQGQLWIASSEVYPHIKPGQKPTDKILVLRDGDGDGTADETTVFADGLFIPTGVLPGDGGVYVANSTELIHLSDSDDDGKADHRRIILSGFGTEDTHHLLHTLRWGHDGMLYMNQSIYIHSHIETPYGVRHLNGGGIWQFRPETMQLEVFCRGFVNSWGHHFDHWGQSFATDGAYGEGINYVFPGAVYVTAVGLKRRLKGLNPGSPKHCGLEIVSGRHLPPDWRGNMITNDFRANRVCRFVISEDGAGYASRQGTELIKSKHVAFRPIDVKMGPDGAIYIADWYNPIIQHGEVDFRDPRRDHVHGRIWRVTAKGRKTLKHPDLLAASTPELLDYLKTPEEWVRLHAKLTLKARGPANVIEPLRKWLSQLAPTNTNFEHNRLEALWVYQGLRHPDPELLSELLQSKDHRVRAAAMRVVPQWRDHLDDAIAKMQAGIVDEHPRVRLESVRALSQMNSVDAARLALMALDRPMDRFLDFALWQAMRDLQSYWLPAVQDGSEDFGGNSNYLTFALQAVDSPGIVQPLLRLVESGDLDKAREDNVLGLIATLGSPKELRSVFDLAVTRRRAGLLQSLVDATRSRKTRPEGDLTALNELMFHENDALSSAALRGAGAWKLAKFRDQFVATARDDRLSQARRAAALEALSLLGDVDSRKSLMALAGPDSKPWQRQEAIVALIPLNANAAARGAADLLEATDSKEISPSELVSRFSQFKSGPKALAAAIKSKQLNPDTAKLAVRAVQASPQPSKELIEALRAAGRLQDAGWKPTPELIAGLVRDVAERGDPHRGEAVYRRREMQCMKCHAIGGAGGRVGPDLLSVGASAPVDYLVDSLIDPNKKIKENFHSISVITGGGRVITGVPVSQAGGVLVLRTADDKEVAIPQANIDEKKEGRSLMADGLVNSLTRDELVDLVKFLSQLGKVGEFSVSKQRFVRRWESLAWTPEGHRRLNRTSYDTAATDDPALVWEPSYSRVTGDLPVGQLPKFVTHRNNDATSFLRFQINVTTAGKVGLSFASTDATRIWIDSKPTPIKSTLELPFAKGKHTITLAINRVKQTEPLRVELVDVKNSKAQAQLVGGK